MARLTPATFVAGGAFAVHQLSYLVGGGASHALQGQSHAYLEGLLPLVAVLTALTLLGAVEGGIAGATARRPAPAHRALAYAAAIFAVFAAQELAEAILGAHGVAALASPVVVAAIPLALCFGGIAWLAVRGLEAFESAIAARFEPVVRPRSGSGVRPRWLPLVLTPALVPGGAAPRAPPSI
jgi:hypothetical protein